MGRRGKGAGKLMYNKLFGKILDSSVWLEHDKTRIVWITLRAAMDEDGFAHFSAIQNLADRAKVSVKATQAAIDKFQAPDPDSGNPANEGRRIERVPGGWMILNASFYRELFSMASKREKTRERVARFRAKSKGGLDSVTEALPNVTPVYVSEYTSEFDSFWNLYPVHKAKGQAFKAWQKLEPDSAMQAAFAIAIESQKTERAALSAAGRFVPEWKYAGTWLNQKCWLDEPTKTEDMGADSAKAPTRKLSAVETVRKAGAERDREDELRRIGRD